MQCGLCGVDQPRRVTLKGHVGRQQHCAKAHGIIFTQTALKRFALHRGGHLNIPLI
jgi:hypothetical protein